MFCSTKLIIKPLWRALKKKTKQREFFCFVQQRWFLICSLDAVEPVDQRRSNCWLLCYTRFMHPMLHMVWFWGVLKFVLIITLHIWTWNNFQLSDDAEMLLQRSRNHDYILSNILNEVYEIGVFCFCFRIFFFFVLFRIQQLNWLQFGCCDSCFLLLLLLLMLLLFHLDWQLVCFLFFIYSLLYIRCETEFCFTFGVGGLLHFHHLFVLVRDIFMKQDACNRHTRSAWLMQLGNKLHLFDLFA